MAEILQVFKKHSIKIALLLSAFGLIYWMYVIPPKYVGYAPDQPIPFNHKTHAGEMNMDCRFCHSGVEKGPHATVPDVATCIRCHQEVASDSPYVQYMRTSYDKGIPIRWTKVHDLPDHARFSHKPHIARLGGLPDPETGLPRTETIQICKECHGDMRTVTGKVEVKADFNMGWCVNCHRNYQHITQVEKPGNNNTAHLTECGTCHY